MKKLIPLLILYLTYSCQLFENKLVNENELLEKKLKEINWKTVDKLPTISLCDSVTDKNERNRCFFRFFTQEIKFKLGDVQLSKFYPKNKILNIKVTVILEQDLIFESDISKNSFIYNKTKIDSILKVNLIDFPAVNPAMKKGIIVKTSFIIPYLVTK